LRLADADADADADAARDRTSDAAFGCISSDACFSGDIAALRVRIRAIFRAIGVGRCGSVMLAASLLRATPVAVVAAVAITFVDERNGPGANIK
jgi:hypothetical protein